MIIVDTNVIISFLLTKGITHQVIAAHKDVFITPEDCYNEVWEHRREWNRNDLPEKDLKEMLDGVQRLFVYPVSQEVYLQSLENASELIKDPDDAPVVALALAIHNEGIWTYDKKHFCTEKLQTQIKVLSTSDVVERYPVKEE